MSIGAHTSVVEKYGGMNSGGMTPTIVRGRPSTTTELPMTSLARASFSPQNLALTTMPSGSCGVQMRPSAGDAPSRVK